MSGNEHGGRRDHTQTAAAAYQLSQPLQLDTNKNCHVCALCSCELLTLMHYQRTNLWYSSVTNFRYWLIHESLIFARILAAGMGVGLYTGMLIREYIC